MSKEVRIEEILGKKAIEVPFCEDSNEMISYVDAIAVVLNNEQAKVLYRKMETHYRNLSSQDGSREAFKAVSKYFAKQAEEREERTI